VQQQVLKNARTVIRGLEGKQHGFGASARASALRVRRLGQNEIGYRLPEFAGGDRGRQTAPSARPLALNAPARGEMLQPSTPSAAHPGKAGPALSAVGR